MRPKYAAMALAVPLAALAANGVHDRPSTYESCAAALDTEVCTWAVMDDDQVVEMGATIPMSLIEAVPADAEMVWPPVPLVSLPLPAEASAALGIDHMAVNWEAHGHPPQTYLAQHFDFHFYSITEADVEAIDCSDETKPSSLPPGYALPDISVPGMGTLVGLCVPQMGMHAMPQHDVSADDPFHASMMLGYYGGRAIFVEPMVSRDVLMKQKSFELAVPTVEGLPSGVHYPATFRADFDEAADAYRLVFGGFGSS
jgi:hypothetical protein